MQVPEEARVRRSQRDYSLPFKLAVVGEVARGELSYKQAQRRYGIQGRSTVLAWCRKHAPLVAIFRGDGPISPALAPPAVEPTPEQRIKQLETALREQRRQYEKQLRDEQEKNLLLRTMLQVVEEDHGIPLPKKSPAAVSRLKAAQAMSVQRACQHFGVSRQSLYQRRARARQRAAAEAQVLAAVATVRTRLPRLGTRKGLHKIAPVLRDRRLRCGRDGLFALLRRHGQLVAPKRQYRKTTDSHHRFRKHPNRVKDAPPPTAPNQRWVSDLIYLPTRQGTVYLSLVTDAYSRKIVGAHVQASLHADGCRAALAQALNGCPPARRLGLVHHSDRGTQYCSDAYQRQLRAAGLVCSMTEGTGDCYQNALAERVNGILKDEFLFVTAADLDQARRLVTQAVQLYNDERPHLALQYATPTQVHQQATSPAGKSERGPCLISVNI
ncbi:IS3 family transposase [Hymenobacter montanus]|uniref:IS3 family transposase n=1 Tax=Hymenobacter montanus TaxID=2771359 RepID=UPI003743E686